MTAACVAAGLIAVLTALIAVFAAKASRVPCCGDLQHCDLLLAYIVAGIYAQVVHVLVTHETCVVGI